MPGLIHIYCGDGKGKTTAAVGLALRAAGAGKRVLLAQFFKDGSSGEVPLLGTLPGISLMHCQTVRGLWKRMDDAQKAQVTADHTAFFAAITASASTVDLLVLDEILSACGHGTVPERDLATFLREKPEDLEVVLTGRTPAAELVELADYVTRMQKVKHPYDRGIFARKGIEF